MRGPKGQKAKPKPGKVIVYIYVEGGAVHEVRVTDEKGDPVDFEYEVDDADVEGEFDDDELDKDLDEQEDDE